MFYIIILLIAFLALYLLYESGFIALQNKHAMLFTASINGMKAKFGGCTGKITRVVRFREQKEYIIHFERTVEKGSVRLCLYDGENNALIESGEKETYALSLIPGKRYKICIQLDKATGSYHIDIA